MTVNGSDDPDLPDIDTSRWTGKGIQEAGLDTLPLTKLRAVAIPPQLQRPDVRFIRVASGTKKAMDKGWNTTENFAYDTPRMVLHVGGGFNYGLFPAAGSRLIVIDVDNVNAVAESGALEGLPPTTFSVETGSSTPEHPKRHLYLEMDAPPFAGKRPFFHPETGEHLGEVYCAHPDKAKAYCVGPGSHHTTTGRPYTIGTDVPIATLTGEGWARFEAALLWEEPKPERPVARRTVPRGESFGSALGLDILDVWTLPQDAVKVSGEWRFGHPAHGSTTGYNLSVNTDTGVWHCFRHSSGGDALMALAVDAGIIDCSEAGSGALADAAFMQRVKEEARRRGFDVDGAEAKQREQWRREQAAKATAPKGAGAAAEAPTVTKPQVQVNNRQLTETTADAMLALRAMNAPPRIFVRSGLLTRVVTDEDGRPLVQTMTEVHVRADMAEAADFVKITATTTGGTITLVTKEVSPPLELAQNVMANRELCTMFPPLRGILECPAIRADGGLIVEAGYDAKSGLYYAPANELTVPEIPESPTDEDVAEAVALLKEVICDFPFVMVEDKDRNPTIEANRANALAAMMTPVLRPMFTGCSPLFLLDKPQAGTGASLLGDAIAVIATGGTAAMLPPPKRDEEWAKSLFAQLLAGRPIGIYDNFEGVLKSPELALTITSRTPSGRRLGTSESPRLENNMTLFVTGINITLGGDMPRRCVWIRMNALSAKPWMRGTAFTHPDLIPWLTANRGRVIAAILTVARRWMNGGCQTPKDVPILGSFEDWSRVLGGILASAGIDGFLANLSQQYEETDIETPQWGGFFLRWFVRFKSDAITVAQLVRELESNARDTYPENTLLGVAPEELLEVLRNNRKVNHSIGVLLRHRKETLYETGVMLQSAGEKHHAARWRVVVFAPPVSESSAPEGGDGSTGEDATTDSPTDSKNAALGVVQSSPIPPSPPPIGTDEQPPTGPGTGVFKINPDDYVRLPDGEMVQNCDFGCSSRVVLYKERGEVYKARVGALRKNDEANGRLAADEKAPVPDFRRICAACYEAAKRRDSIGTVPLPGAIAYDEVERLAVPERNTPCRICKANGVTHWHRDSRTRLCSGCYEKFVREQVSIR